MILRSLITVWLISRAICFAQASDFYSMVSRISQRDRVAILEAGKSRDQSFVPVLRSVLSRTGKKDFYNREPLVDALAKLGDREQQQQIYCQTKKTFGLDVDPVDFEYIGGGFSVRVLAVLLDSDAEFDKKVKQPIGGDVFVLPPSWSALRQFPKIVPNPPVRKQEFPSRQEHDQAVQIWKNWIASHQSDLDKLQPSGEGVIFTTAGCQRR